MCACAYACVRECVLVSVYTCMCVCEYMYTKKAHNKTSVHSSFGFEHDGRSIWHPLKKSECLLCNLRSPTQYHAILRTRS